MTGAIGQVLRFGIVGGAATAVHFAVASWSIMAGGSPHRANALAFAIAFLVSFVGHRRFTFGAVDTPLLGSVARFASIAMAAFVLNGAVFAILLEWAAVPVLVALAVAIGFAATFTFLAGRCWAFAAPEPMPAGPR